MRPLLAAATIAVVALLVSEVTMQPTPKDRVILVGIVLAVTLVSAVSARVLARVTRRVRVLRQALLVSALGALGAVLATVVGSALTMFVSTHDLRLTLVAVALGAGLGGVLATVVAQPLADDLASIRATAEAVADGERDVATGVVRNDEVGALAVAVDAMVAELAAADAETAAVDTARRDFLAAVSHDLRTPLTSLKAAIEAMEDGIADDPARYLRAMRTDVDLLSALVADLFLLARIESGGLQLNPVPMDLRELVDEAAEAVAPLAAATFKHVAVTADGPAPVSGDEHALRRVLRHLIDNALRHAPRSSTVTIATRSDPGTSHITLRVTDEGPGFDPRFVDRAFDRFTRADAARTRDGSGAGLGLALTRGLVEAHGGTVAAAPGPGGRVTVTLPTRGG